jgi:hypothetical protein
MASVGVTLTKVTRNNSVRSEEDHTSCLVIQSVV